eukprot:COSAG05_NODE_1584_length_4486_cov_402.617506_8_plen_66_part_00
MRIFLWVSQDPGDELAGAEKAEEEEAVQLSGFLEDGAGHAGCLEIRSNGEPLSFTLQKTARMLHG